MEEFLNFVLRRLASRPDEVFVMHAGEGDKTVFTIRAPRSDMPRIIGKRGQTIHAMRGLLNAAAAKQGCRVKLVAPD